MFPLARDLWTRRTFLSLLGAVPGVAVAWGWAPRLIPGGRAQDPLITSPDQALNVLDFEAVARAKLPPAHFGYLATGVDDDATLRANREGFARLQIRARRLVDVSRVDLGIDLLGQRLDNPILIAPCGSQRAFHPQGEVAVARAAKARGHLMMLSTVSTTSVEEVTAARGEPVWYQLYPTSSWEVARSVLQRAEAAGCPVVVLTVDLNAGTNRETAARAQRLDTRPCADCHQPGPSRVGLDLRRKPMFDGLEVRDLAFETPRMTWDFVRRLRDATRMKVMIKGIVTREDAELCVRHGVDGLIVSNHGGRAEESGRATIESLPEVVEAAAGRIPVVVDGGIRRGTDIYKALALGATAVGIGRPYLWGLAAFGQAGVERVLELLGRELALAMRHAGATAVRGITPESVLWRRSE
jgi:isopentenyl diphosphate isomerase/L-lactate dehydrogenase-like FMN-dependent dehydrogenase